MASESRFLTLLSILARVVGAVWIFIGLVFLFITATMPEDRVIRSAISMFFTITGVALVLAKRPTQRDIDRFTRP